MDGVSFMRDLIRRPTFHLRSLRIELNMFYNRLRSDSYEEAYAKHMNWRVKHQGKEAVGGWEKGERQFDRLCERGLAPDHQLLEIGCGTLRAGQYFVEYLDSGNYYGIDVSPDAIEEGKSILGDELLETKQPNLIVNEDLRFTELRDETFDFIHSIGVFTHIPPATVREAFENLPNIMHEDSLFYASFNIDGRVPAGIKISRKSFEYTEQELKELATQSGLKLEVVDDLPMSSNIPQTTVEVTLR
jgi:SAM-dependent methyltransferase